jgi:hypothetical protein
MALITSDSCCAICGEDLSRPHLAASGCAFSPDHRLFRFCDAPLHISCLERWDDRAEFARADHDQARDSWSTHGTLLHVADEWFVGTGPAVPPSIPYLALVWLRDWPLRLYTRFVTWDAFLAGNYAEDLTGAALLRADAIMSELRDLLPDQASLVAAWRGLVDSQPRRTN